MPPVNKMSKWDITFIRPMMYIREKELRNFVNQKEIPYSGCNCPIWDNTMRNKIKYWIIWDIEEKFPDFTENIFHALVKDFVEKYEKDWFTM